MAIYIVIAIIFCIAFPIIYRYFYKINLRKKFEGSYLDWDNEDYDFENLSMIRRYLDSKKEAENPNLSIDDITWDDLDMDLLYFKMNCCQSSVGEEYLYTRLRYLEFDQSKLKNFDNAVEFMDKHSNTKIEALCALHLLGKDLYNHVYAYIYKIDEQSINNILPYYFLGTLPLLSIIICFFTPLGFALLLISFCINIVVFYRKKYKLDVNIDSVTYISKMVYCASKMARLDFGETDYKNQIKAAIKPLRSISRIGRYLSHKNIFLLDFLLDYVKIVFMWDFVQYNRMIRILKKHKNEFHQIYKIVGEIDAAIAIGEYRKTLPFYTTPSFWDENNVTCIDVFHPLVKNPVFNSINWYENSIITGSNASGKSTFIKSLAINMLCAQSIYLCFAKEFNFKMSLVITSMAVKDNIYNGESYFIAEIKSLKRIMDALNENIPIVCFIDEILKGTNTIERIASSTSILKCINEKNCKVMVASHDIELTEILKNHFHNYCFKEQILEDGIFFDYKIYEGSTVTRNAISLLKFMGYDEEIISTANELVSNFEEKRLWSVI